MYQHTDIITLSLSFSFPISAVTNFFDFGYFLHSALQAYTNTLFIFSKLIHAFNSAKSNDTFFSFPFWVFFGVDSVRCKSITYKSNKQQKSTRQILVCFSIKNKCSISNITHEAWIKTYTQTELLLAMLNENDVKGDKFD